MWFYRKRWLSWVWLEQSLFRLHHAAQQRANGYYAALWKVLEKSWYDDSK